MTSTDLEILMFWVNFLSQNPNGFDSSTPLDAGTQWDRDVVDQHNVIKSDTSYNSTSRTGTSGMENQDPNAEFITDNVSCSEFPIVIHASPVRYRIPCVVYRRTSIQYYSAMVLNHVFRYATTR